ncbi:FG-GAP-like repeat-containing protein [Micromonospora sp. NPDC000089]|uniref:FG-GAP-like repeat-containing protein n=1 Tax=unclassified Micromonospora TaxID=2617518 RepID=UPI0036CE34D5
MLGATAVAPGAATAAPAPAPARFADFNNDGYPDLAVSAATAPAGTVSRAGAVAVAYGSPSGLRYDNASIVNQGTPGVPGDPVDNGQWRAVTDFGDLDHDGYDDLVIRWGDAGTVLWGSAAGITGAGVPVASGTITDGVPQLLGRLAVGDVNGDGIDDLVSRGWDTGASSGLVDGVAVLLGPLNHTTGQPAGRWWRNTEKLDNLQTYGVNVGDLTGDGIADIAVAGGVVGASTMAWMVLKGSPSGPVKGSAWNGPYGTDWPHPTAVGDINRDGYADVVEGYPFTSRFYVIYGGPAGISATLPPRLYTQASPGVPGVDEKDDKFGSAVAIGDTDRDGYPDLVVGTSYETGSDPATTWRSGAVTVLRGSAGGLTTTGAKVLTQNSSGIPSTSEREDHFGAAVEIIDSDRNGTAEVYVGGNGEDGYRGRIWKLQTGATGVTGTGATSFQLGDLGGPTGGNFGAYLVG